MRVNYQKSTPNTETKVIGERTFDADIKLFGVKKETLVAELETILQVVKNEG